MATNLPEYLERGLAAIAYGEAKQMRGWMHDHDKAGYYPTSDTDDLRIHIARQLLVLAETPIFTVLPHRAHGCEEGCECKTCAMIQDAHERADVLHQETY